MDLRASADEPHRPGDGLMAWPGVESNFLRAHEMRVTDFGYSEFDCDLNRHAAGKSTSACLYILAQEAPSFLLTGRLTVPTQQEMKALVDAYDQSGRAARGGRQRIHPQTHPQTWSSGVPTWLTMT